MDIKKTLQYWHKLEHFHPYILQEQYDKNIKPFRIDKAERFPDFQNPKIEDNKIIRYYNVYFGIFKVDSALNALEKAIGKKMCFRDTGKDESCFCKFSLDAQGIFNPNSFRVSSFPWAIHRVRDGKIDIDEWDEAFHSFEASLFLYFKDFNQPMTYEFLLEARNHFANSLNWDIHFNNAWLRIDRVSGRKQNANVSKAKSDDNCNETPEEIEPDTQAENEETDALIRQNDLLNSFYVRDLERMIASISNSAPGKSFRNYLEHKAENRIDIENNPDVLLELMSPRNLPKGRWPSDYGLRFMQQVDVNAFLSETQYEQPLFSVNGPPGTGKTTLLKDIIAGIVVNRAIAMCDLPTPDDAFTEEISQIITPTKNGAFTNHVYELKPEIRRYGILVTSNNNAAVENITHSLPSINEIPKKYNLEEYQYFSEVTDLLFGQGKTWALNAAALGNRDNCTKFVDKFWPLNKTSGNTYDLNKFLTNRVRKISKHNWEEAKKKFQEKLKKVNEEYQRIESIYGHALKARQYMVIEKEINDIKSSEHTISEQLAMQRQEREHLLQEINHYRMSLKEMRKNDWFLPIKSIVFSHSHWCIAYRNLKNHLKSYEKRLLEKNQLIDETVKKQQVLRTKLKELKEKRSNLEDDFAKAREELEKFKVQTNSPFRVDEYFAGSPNEELSKSSPWGYPELNHLRETLFLEALQLHKAFAKNSERLRDNLDAFAKLLRRMLTASDAKIAASALLQSFFLIVPVVSTTFASVGSFLKDIPPEDIGYLFIDEAGQAMPQAAAGAIWRAKKVIAVGDPMQIEPVVTLHDSVIDALGKLYGQDSIITNKYTSVQSLSDLANKLGTWRALKNQNNLWVGAPLVVHSRCQRKVYDISNEIAYNKKMIYDNNKSREDAVCAWLHVYGNSQNGHYVPEQAKKILPIIINCFKNFATQKDPSQKYPSLFVITPFCSVRAGLKLFFKENLNIELNKHGIAVNDTVVTEWIRNCIGTVHTFQGKEADTVVFCLGGDSGGKSEGAVQWACERPNILNVAITRSRQDLYIVGDQSVWGHRDNFKSALTHCI